MPQRKQASSRQHKQWCIDGIGSTACFSFSLFFFFLDAVWPLPSCSFLLFSELDRLIFSKGHVKVIFSFFFWFLFLTVWSYTTWDALGFVCASHLLLECLVGSELMVVHSKPKTFLCLAFSKRGTLSFWSSWSQTRCHLAAFSLDIMVLMLIIWNTGK